MIFDSDVLVLLLRDDAVTVRSIEAEADRKMSIVSLMELIQGARSKSEVQTIRRLLVEHDFEVIPVNEQISYLAALLMEEYSPSHGLQLADALIAATARERGETLMTGNVRHFRSPPALHIKAFRRPHPGNGGS